MGGNIYAQPIDNYSTRLREPRRGPLVLAHIEQFNLNSFDGVEVVGVTPPGNVLSVRSQEMRPPYSGGSLEINRFDFVLDSSSLMRMFLEAH
jgi:hypothetical protein